MSRKAKKVTRSRRKIVSVFKPADTLIYRFDECGKRRAVDPLRVAAELAGSDPSLDFLFKNMTLPTPDCGKYATVAAGIVRKAFGITEQREENGEIVGMTDGDCLGVYYDFYEWTNALKKKLQPLPTFAPPSERDGLPTVDSPTTNTSVSGSCETASSSDKESPPSSLYQPLSESQLRDFLTH